MTVYFMIKKTLQDLKNCAHEFSSIKNVVNNFIEYTNKMLNELEDYEIKISNNLTQISEKKKLDNSMVPDLWIIL